MKPDWVPTDGAYHAYCWQCRQETTAPVEHEGLVHYACYTCGGIYPRRLVFDPEVGWWLDETGEYCHEAAGVFVRDPGRRFLFFERTGFPFGLTVPAGHLAPGEAPVLAAGRELFEETGLASGDALTWVGTSDIVGDQCRRGADVHRWHAFELRLRHRPQVSIADEGRHPVWLTLTEALAHGPTPATAFVINRYGHVLARP